jgi:hypothetical protein
MNRDKDNEDEGSIQANIPRLNTSTINRNLSFNRTNKHRRTPYKYIVKDRWEHAWQKKKKKDFRTGNKHRSRR